MGEAEKGKTVSLVLGSGGARGHAHIGVIHYLEEEGYEIKSVTGSSVGALIGGVYALGRLDEYEKRAEAITKVDLVALLDITFQGGGLVRGDRIMEKLREFLGEARIEDLPVQFTAVATDIESAKEVWITKGPLFDAIRASISLPLFFTPAVINDVRLVDGGVLNPVPIAPTFGDETELTIAVNLNGPRSGKERPRPAKREDSVLDEFRVQIKEFIGKMGVEPSTSKKDWSFQEVASQSFETMQSAIARQKLAAYPPDVLIEIPRDACRTLEFDRAGEMVALGYGAAHDAFKRLLEE